jgi:membrane-associated PAP2 superfamily phosphatase
MESPTLSNQGMSPLPAEGRWLGEGGEPNVRMISGEEELAVVHAGETEGPAGPPLWLPLVILLVATAVVRFCNLDLWLARRVYAGDGDWTFDLHLLVQALYRYGTWPAVLVSVAAAVVLVGSRYVRRLRSGRSLAWLIVLSLLVGPGLLANAIFKDHFGRPRPRDIVEFGGQREFAAVGEPRMGQKGKSFPCGHATMGFFWLKFTVFYCERNRRLALGFLLLGLIHGGCLGFGRLAQGGHWLSDVVWAAGISYLVAWQCGAPDQSL